MEIDYKILKKAFLGGIGYKASGLIISRIINVLKIFLFARLFTPSEIGTATLAIFYVSTISAFGNFGFYESVIRNKDRTRRLANSSFTLSLLIGLFLFFITIIGSFFLSKIFNLNNLNLYISFSAFLVLIIPLQFPKVFFEKKINFFNPTVAIIILDSITFIVALIIQINFKIGVWSLLIGNILGLFISSVYLWHNSDYRPKLELHTNDIKPLLIFGLPFMLEGLNAQIMDKADNLIVSKFYGPTQFAYYNFAWQLPLMLTSLASIIDRMFFPVFALIHKDENSVRKIFNLTNKMWSILGSFIGFGVILFADKIVLLLYGDRWIPVIPILKVMSLSYLIRFCTGYSYDNLVLIRGRTSYMMKWGFINTLLIFSLGLYMIKEFGPIGGAWFWVLQAIILIPLIRFPLIIQELHTLEFIKHIWQPVVSGVIASVCIYSLLNIPINNFSINWLILVIIYIVVFFFSLVILDNNFIYDLKRLNLTNNK